MKTVNEVINRLATLSVENCYDYLRTEVTPADIVPFLPPIQRACALCPAAVECLRNPTPEEMAWMGKAIREWERDVRCEYGPWGMEDMINMEEGINEKLPGRVGEVRLLAGHIAQELQVEGLL